MKKWLFFLSGYETPSNNFKNEIKKNNILPHVSPTFYNTITDSTFQKEERNFIILGIILIITAFISSIGVYYVFKNFISDKLWVALLIAFFWFFVVLAIDSAVVRTLKPSYNINTIIKPSYNVDTIINISLLLFFSIIPLYLIGWNKHFFIFEMFLLIALYLSYKNNYNFTAVFFRFILAFIISLITTTAIELQVFNDVVKQEFENLQASKLDLLDNTAQIEISNKESKLKEEISKLEDDIKSLRKEKKNLEKKINAYQGAISYELYGTPPTKNQKYLFEKFGILISGKPGKGVNYYKFKNQQIRAEEDLDDIVSHIKEKQAKLRTIEQKLEESIKKVNKEIENRKSSTKNNMKNSIYYRITALYSLIEDKNILLLVISIFLFTIEMLPLFFKLIIGPSISQIWVSSFEFINKRIASANVENANIKANETNEINKKNALTNILLQTETHKKVEEDFNLKFRNSVSNIFNHLFDKYESFITDKIDKNPEEFIEIDNNKDQ